MKALRVTFRGKQRTIALEDQGVLQAIVACKEGCKFEPAEANDLVLGGLDIRTGSYLEWDKVDLELGDKVVVEVIENCVGDPPDEIRPRDREKELAGKKRYVREAAKELGWTIVEGEGDGEAD